MGLKHESIWRHMTSQFILCGPFTDSSKNRTRPGSLLKVDVIPPLPGFWPFFQVQSFLKLLGRNKLLWDVVYIKECLLQALCLGFKTMGLSAKYVSWYCATLGSTHGVQLKNRCKGFVTSKFKFWRVKDNTRYIASCCFFEVSLRIFS